MPTELASCFWGMPRCSRYTLTAFSPRQKAIRHLDRERLSTHVTGNDPDKRDRLIKGLDVFLERDRDRELFELAPNKEISDGNPD